MDQLLLSLPLSEALICAQPYLRVIWRKGAGAGNQAGREISSLLSSPGLCVGINFSMVISEESKRFGKAVRRRPVRLHFASLSHSLRVSPSFLPALLFGVASAAGRSHAPPPPCISPSSFSLRCAPPRYVRFRNGLAFRQLGMTTGWAGVAQPAGAHALVTADASLCKVCGATGRRVGRETAAPRAPSSAWARKVRDSSPPRRPTFPGLDRTSLRSSRSVPSSSGKLWESQCERRRFRFRGQVAFFRLMIFARADLTLRHSRRGASVGRQEKAAPTSTTT